MAKFSLVLCSILVFIMTHSVLAFVSDHRGWWPPHGTIKIKYPYKKVSLSWLHGTMNPCHGVIPPICGTNFVTYDNPCDLCIESLKSHGKIKFHHDDKC